jgi:hypothetical protein
MQKGIGNLMTKAATMNRVNLEGSMVVKRPGWSRDDQQHFSFTSRFKTP